MHRGLAAAHDRETLRLALISSVDEALGEITHATIRQVAREQGMNFPMLGTTSPHYSSARLLRNSSNNCLLVATPGEALLTYSPRSYGVHSALLAQSLNLRNNNNNNNNNGMASLLGNHHHRRMTTTTDALLLAAASFTRADPNKLLGAAAESQARLVHNHQRIRESNHHHHHHHLMQDSIVQALLLHQQQQQQQQHHHQASKSPVVSVPSPPATNNSNTSTTTHLFEVLNSNCHMPSPCRVATEAPSSLEHSTEYQVTRTLQALGSSIRRRTDPYVDCTKLALPAKYKNQGKASPSRGGLAEPFPEKLFRMLSDTEQEGWTDIVSFLPHGRSFAVRDPDRFVQEIMPRYFQQTKWSSFTRQLNLWGFLRVRAGPDVGAFYHELFLKGYPGLCTHMRRVGTSTSGRDRRKFKCKITEGGDPDFYAMEPLR